MSPLIQDVLKILQTPKKIIFRFDAGRVDKLSFGHFYRQKLFIEGLGKVVKFNFIVLMKDYKDGLSIAKKEGYEVVTIKKDISIMQEQEIIKHYIKDFRADWIILDLPPNYEMYDLKQFNISSIAFDDMVNNNICADIIINSMPWVESSDYINCTEDKKLLGLKYLLIDEKPKYKLINTKNNVLVTMGGSDPKDITYKIYSVVRELKTLNSNFYFVLGFGFPKERIEQFKEYKNIKIIIEPESLIGLMGESDLIICSGGRVLFESLSMEKKVLSIASAEHEKIILRKAEELFFNLNILSAWDKKLFRSKLLNILDCIN